MGHTHIITSYVSINEDEKLFAFGASAAQVKEVDGKIYEKKEDTAHNWGLERRGGYSTEFIEGKLVAVLLRKAQIHKYTFGVRMWFCGVCYTFRAYKNSLPNKRG
ncbi:MAG: hypothetical protein ACK5JF_00215 [Oscillospiraceae bacterium]